jgi:hypothetical protein
MNIQAEQLSRVLEKYSLSRPLSPADQRYILGRSRSSLRRLLKARGAYGLFFGMIIATGYLFRKMGIKLTLLQSKIIAGVTAAVMTAGSATGAYRAGEYIKEKITGRPQEEKVREESIPAEPELRSTAEIQKHYNKLEEINLDDGTRIIGAVIYQDSETIRIHTEQGIIRLPVKSVTGIKIKEIKSSTRE